MRFFDIWGNTGEQLFAKERVELPEHTLLLGTARLQRTLAYCIKERVLVFVSSPGSDEMGRHK